MRRARVALFAWTSLLVGSCVNPPTQVLVWFDIESNSMTAARAYEVEVRVLDQDATARLESGGRLQGEPPLLSLPASVSVLPRDGDASRRYRVEVTLRDEAGSVLGVQVAEGGFVENELRETRLWFSDACLDVSCPGSRTCIAGECPRACFAPRPVGDARPSEPDFCPDEQCPGDVCDRGVCTPQNPVLAIAVGYEFACAVVQGGEVRCWGANGAGQLGVEGIEASAEPLTVPLPGPALRIAAGGAHACAVLESGALYCWGANQNLQLGHPGPGGPLPEAVTLPGGSGSVDLVAAGESHTCATNSDRELFCWGNNGDGQIGNGVAGEPEPPTLVMRDGSSDGVLLTIGAGEHTSCFLMEVGRIWCWGANFNGELGQGDREPRYFPTQVVMGDGLLDGGSFTEMAVGAWHLCALADAGRLFCWGDMANGRLGLGPVDFDGQKITVPTLVTPAADWRGRALSAGRRHTCAIRDDSALWCFGTNASGLLGIGPGAMDEIGPVELTDRGWLQLAMGDNISCGTRGEPGAEALFCWGRALGGTADSPAIDEPRRVCFR